MKLLGTLCDTVAKRRSRDLGVPGSSLAGSTGFVLGVSLGKTLQSPNLVLVKPITDMKM